ncbi:uncharacterized protein PHALS_05776 [Plasmopara halstedii]|uniref:Uncharacterized protein n=1 Tax=Plasmopara halstedii TaxID=4781 RepID=A0A0P1AAR9_PLAHL|nr:uncharacterized protein PHALS_05776 [Plasmopara halstedii]CEG37719.1 hypothetical protein PHALS_05776 [Plasmopara halstedii]|eukprot:XP_024574088.1 hypothetical protein PHALS_05776 [Plasmopara halstedii]
MSSQSLCHVLRNGISISARRQALITRGGHAHRPPPPPFARIQVPNQPLHEEAELFQALRHLMLGLSAFATLMGVVTLYDPNSWRQAVKRGDHLLDLKWEMGEADKPEEEMED